MKKNIRYVAMALGSCFVMETLLVNSVYAKPTVTKNVQGVTQVLLVGDDLQNKLLHTRIKENLAVFSDTKFEFIELQSQPLTDTFTQPITHKTNGKQKEPTTFQQYSHTLQHISPVDIAAQNTAQTIVIATNQLASLAMDTLDGGTFTHPHIAARLPTYLKKANKPSKRVQNYNPVATTFDIQQDVQQIHKLFANQKKVVIVDESMRDHYHLVFAQLADNFVDGFSVQYVQAGSANLHISKDSVVYVLPLLGFTDVQKQQLYTQLTKKGVASYAMDAHDINHGALTALRVHDEKEITARRVALAITDIVDGKKVGDLPTKLPQLQKNLVVNTQTLQSFAQYADVFVDAKQHNMQNDMQQDIQQATNSNAVDNSNKPQQNNTSTNINYQQAIDFGLQNNLDIKKSKNDIAIANVEMSEALRTFLPNVDVYYKFTKVDDDFRMVQSSGATEKVSVALDQILFSDEAFAAARARSIGKTASQKGLEHQQNELIYNTFAGLVRLKQAKNQLQIAQNTYQTTSQLLSAMQQKVRVGLVSDLQAQTLQAQKAQDFAALTKARVGVQQSILALEKQLNMPINQQTRFDVLDNTKNLAALLQPQLQSVLRNTSTQKQFIAYITEYALSNNPMLAQLQYSLQAQQKINAATKRRWFVPVIGLRANASKTVKRHDIVENMPERMLSPDWDVSLVAKLPLSSALKNTQSKLGKVVYDKLQINQRQAQTGVQAAVTIAVQNAYAAYQQVQALNTTVTQLTKTVAMTSKLYKKGQIEQTELIKVQNQLQTAKLQQENAKQQLFIDSLAVEKQAGFYFYSATQQQQQAFINDFVTQSYYKK